MTHTTKGESVFRFLLDARKGRKQGSVAIQARQRDRLADIVSFARTHSPYFGELYQTLPGRVEDPRLLPVTDKRALMARFNDWVTDRDVTIDDVRAFVEDPGLIGARFLDKYTVAVTSGTTGTRGIFLMDDRSLKVTNALVVLMMKDWLAAGDVWRIIAGHARMAMICATGGHFAEIVAATRLRNNSRRWNGAIEVVPADATLAEMVSRLNRFRPAIVAPYANTAALLAGEQEAGRLHIRPALMTLSAEGLPDREYDRIATAFRTKVRDGYAATECPFLSYSCEYHWKHVNADWLVFEPVDASYRPVPAGEQSHTVLISNLANRVQPILRYDLGDSVPLRPDPCPCGNPLPAIRVRGRSADILTFPAEHGETVSIAPLVFELDELRGIELSQIVQTAPTTLQVRLRVAQGADAERVWRDVHAMVTRILAASGLSHVSVERATESPEQSPGGKYRTVIPYAGTPK